MSLMVEASYWLPIRDGDLRARGLLNRHYSAIHYKDGRKPAKFVGVGEYQALMTEDSLALWVCKRWRDPSGETGIYNAVFRNEGPILSSLLIQEASGLAWQKWPGERIYTYVDPLAVRSPNPGFCYKRAGWRLCPRRSKSGKLILEVLP